MTESEAIEFVKAFLECKDKEHAVDFNYQCDKDCESCELNYSKGTIGQQTEAMEIAIMALGKQIPKKPVHDGCFDSEGMWHEWNGVNGRLMIYALIVTQTFVVKCLTTTSKSIVNIAVKD